MVLLLSWVVLPGPGATSLADSVLRGELGMGFWWTKPLVRPGDGSGLRLVGSYISDTFQRLEIEPGAFYQKGALFVVARPFVWIGNDTLYPPDWHGIRSEWREAFVGFSTRGFSGYWGKAPVSWGPPLANKLFFDGGRNPPFDCGELAWHNGSIRVSSFLAVLDPWVQVYQIDTQENLQNRLVHQRFVNAHRFELLLWNRLSLAWTEAVIYDRQGDGPDLGYFNPISLMYALSWTGTANSEDDFLWVFSGLLHLKNTMLFGQLLVDDFQYVADTTGDAQQFALALGAMRAVGPATLRADYSMATRWTYNSRLITTRALYRNWPFGHPLGSDFQRFVLEIWSTGPGFRPGGGFSLCYDGAGSVYERMDYAEHYPPETFMVDPVQKEIRAWLRAGLGPLELQLGYRTISNWHHQEGQRVSGAFFTLGIDKSLAIWETGPVQP